jgi:hypothetical protein
MNVLDGPKKGHHPVRMMALWVFLVESGTSSAGRRRNHYADAANNDHDRVQLKTLHRSHAKTWHHSIACREEASSL